MKTEEELCDFLGKDLNKIEKLCRICLSDNLSNAVLICKDLENNIEDVESIEIKLNMNQELSLWEKIAVFGRVKVKYEDDLLKYICEQCYYDVDVAHTFRIKCHKAENLLNRVLQILTGKQDEPGLLEDKKELVNPKFDLSYDVERNKKIDVNIKEEHDDYLSDDYVEVTVEKKKKHTKKIKKNKVLVDGGGDVLYQREQGERKYSCTICSQVCDTKYSLGKHVLVEHKAKKKKLKLSANEKRFQCTECDYKCNRPYEIENHKIIHTGLKPFKCDICSKSFAQRTGLYLHRQIHSETKNYSCQKCTKKFKRRDLLNSHQRAHNKELKFICHICDKGLKTQKTLDEHIKRHLQIKNFSCDVCGMRFVTRVEITNHYRKHNSKDSFKCSTCDYSTYSKKSLLAHTMRHSGNRTHKCEYCDYACYTKGGLTIHLRKHTKEQKYSCPVCEMKFRQSSSVNKHMLQQHGQAYKWNEFVDRRFIK